MMLLIDNYDSFTYNLYQFIGTFNNDIKVVRNDKITSVQTSMSRLKPLIEKDNDELNAEFENAKSGLEWIIESEIPKLTNIL